MQDTCCSTNDAIDCPAPGEAFFGQDALVPTRPPSFTDNGDDNITGLMWAKNRDATGNGKILAEDKLSYEAAPAGAERFGLAGQNDWRLPNVKELQDIDDYTRSPDTTDSPALDPVFDSTKITNEERQADYGWIWSSTTDANWTDEAGNAGAYVSFGRAMGYFDGVRTDVHGAGAQRSDPKTGDPADYLGGVGPQGDAKRIYNFVRLVHDAG